MDPVQHFIYLIEYDRSAFWPARDKVCAAHGIGYAEFEQLLIDARSAASALLRETDAAAEALGC